MKTTIDSQQLRVFSSLAHLKNLSRAAKHLGMTTSGVSHCLKALEVDLGCPLVERSPRRFVLTRAGEEFLTDTRDILERMKSARTKLQASADWRSGELRIGASETACELILPATLREFRESFPDFTVRIQQCSAATAVSLIGEGRLDVALISDPTEFPGMESFLIGEDDLQFYVSPLHPWAIKRKAAIAEIPKRRLILPERSSSTYSLIEAYFRAEHIRIQPFIEISNERAMKEFVRLNLGIGILPRWLVAADVDQGLLVGLPLGRRKLKRHWRIIYPKTRKLVLSDNLFIKICRRVFLELLAAAEA